MAVNPKDLLRHYYTLEEYFALERVGEARYEYWHGEIVCMSGGSLQHAISSSNFIINLGRQLAGGQCRAFTADMAVKTPFLPPYSYPDLSVVCGRPAVEDIEGIAVLTNPVLLVEVLSPGTESRDRNEKRNAYQALPSLREYLLVEQNSPHLTHYIKEHDQWSRRDDADLNTVIALPSIGCRLSLGEVYEGVEFE
jgi:Uma2 family endonuclease